MRSETPLKFGPLSFLFLLLLLCLSGAILFTVISGGGMADLLLVLVPGASASLLSFLYCTMREQQMARSGYHHALAQAMQKIEDEDYSVRLRISDDPGEKDLLDHFNAMASKLAENERQLRTLLKTVEKGKKEWETTFDVVPDYIVLLDREQRILRINRAMADKLGVHPREVIGKVCCPVIHGTGTPPEFCSHKEVISKKIEIQQEIFEPRLGGHLLFSMSPVFDEAGEVVSVVQIGRDINKLEETARELKNARSFMQQVIDSISETMLVIDNDYHILLANKAAKEKFLSTAGAEIEASCCYNVTHGYDNPCQQAEAIRCPLQEVQETGLPVSIVHRHTDKNGTVFHEELSAAPFFDAEGNIGGIIEVGRDISERLQLEEENRKLIRKEARYRKDQSIGTLAGGVAHDFNNSLTAVLGNAELLKLNLTADHEALKFVEQIIAAVHKMANLTKQLLAYAKGGKYLPLKIDIKKTVESAVAELNRQPHGSKVRVSLDFRENIWPLLGDAGQLKQAIGNILINSFEAMKEKGGELTVKIRNHSFADSWECAFNELHPQGDFVNIAIQDNGVGIPREDFERIFEPFYTTKFMGRGLGLPAALGIIQSHGGCLTLESRENHGTTLNVFLPRLKENQEEGAAVQEKAGGKILVVDDEPAVIEYVCTGLALNGFEVITAKDGFEAIEKINQQKDEIGLVILDVFMPGQSGKDVYRQIKGISPGIRIALSSGYDEQVALAGLVLQKEDTFLQKPYVLKALLELAEGSVSKKE